MRQLLEQKKFLPLIVKILNMVSNLRDQYFYEFEIQNQNLVVTMSTQCSDDPSLDHFDFMLVN